MELRCQHKMHGVVIQPGDAVVEIKCYSKFCGHRPGVIVLHRFDCTTGELVETKKYKDTPRVTKERSNALGQRASVRSA